MNRLILLGNGFDLAHGLETSYKAFITKYLYDVINEFKNSSGYDDPLISIRTTYSGHSSEPLPTISIEYGSVKKVLDYLLQSSYTTLNFKSIFFISLIEKIHTLNWVDVEDEYFNSLEKCKKGITYDFKKIELLNEEFDFIKTRLQRYLETIDVESSNIIPLYSKLFCEDFNPEEILLEDLRVSKPENLYFVNFNYTDTLEKYFNICATSVKSQINFIHGELKDQENPIIFGFGDEYDSKYIEFEHHKNNLLFRHIKSFQYMKTTNYHNLIRFINSGSFQVYVVGHSCGLSDRTMLKKIFEHEYCKSIKIIHHERADGTNDYTEKTFDISRHFSDKGLMREKIVPFNNLDKMPQART